MVSDIQDEILTKFRGANLERLRAAGFDSEHVDPDRLREVIANAIGCHPDRGQIIAHLDAGMWPFVEPCGAEFELSVGYHVDPALNPAGVEAGKSIPLGTIPVYLVMRLPQG